jgi:hypothetical protein
MSGVRVEGNPHKLASITIRGEKIMELDVEKDPEDRKRMVIWLKEYGAKQVQKEAARVSLPFLQVLYFKRPGVPTDICFAAASEEVEEAAGRPKSCTGCQALHIH